jgi:Cu+-exporting ATPase
MAKKAKLKIMGMHCASCAMSIDGDLEDTEGVKSAKTSYASQVCEVEFEEEVVTIEEIIKTVDQTGYKAEAQANG